MHIPQFIVLDAHSWLLRLRGMANHFADTHDCCASEYFVLDLSSEVVDRLRECHRAESQLREFCASIRAGVEPCGGDIVPPAFAPTVFEYGMALFAQLRELRAYLPNGVLPYHFHLLPRREDNVTVVLEKTGELPP